MAEEYCKSALIFPSYIETVGLPLVEAMSVGAVILAADCEYAHEVLDGYENAFLFDPFKPAELAGLMNSCIDKRITRTINIDEKIPGMSSWHRLVFKII